MPYRLINSTTPWVGWAPDTPLPSTELLYELAVWPDAVNGSITVTVGGHVINIEAVKQPWKCTVGESACYVDQMRGRVLPVSVSGGFGGMTSEVRSQPLAADSETAMKLPKHEWRVDPRSATTAGSLYLLQVCAAMCKEANFTADDVCGTENSDECWCGKLSASAQKLNDSACQDPCGGNLAETCGG